MQNAKENGRGKEVAKKIAKKSGLGLGKGGETVLSNTMRQTESGLEKRYEIIPNNAVKQRERGLQGIEIPEKLTSHVNSRAGMCSRASHMIHQVIKKRNHTCLVRLEKTQREKSS